MREKKKWTMKKKEKRKRMRKERGRARPEQRRTDRPGDAWAGDQQNEKNLQ